MRNTKKTTQEFIKEAMNIHGDKYDYSLVDYKTAKDKVKIICNIHGLFEQTPDSHINKKSNCQKCSGNKKLTTEEFILKAKLIHGNKYDYSLVDYVNDSNKVNIICLEHGIFIAKAGNHLRGDRCSMCTNNKKLTTEEFINKAKLIHGNKYNYSLVNYTNQSKKITIICDKHGEFKQNPNNHLNNNGCPICKESKGEKEIRNYLENNNIKFIPQYRFPDCKNILELPFDFYLPDYNICIEYNGRQHYEPINLWGGKKALETQQLRDKIKMEYCRDNNIPLIIIKHSDKNIYKLINPKTQWSII
jgi:hypothetical protein